MNQAVKKQATSKVVEKIEDYLEERKLKADRRQTHVSLPSSIERRTGTDRRN